MRNAATKDIVWRARTDEAVPYLAQLAADLLANIVHPSQGISFGYETWLLEMKDGSSLRGILASKTETDIDIKFPGGAKQQLKTSDVKSMKELKESMMPEGLYASISNQDMANLLEYLSGLKKK